MRNRVGEYLDIASDEKERIRKTAWNGFGLTFISNQTRTMVDFATGVKPIAGIEGRGTRLGVVITEFRGIQEGGSAGLLVVAVRQPSGNVTQ